MLSVQFEIAIYDREPIFCISVFPLVCQVHISLRF